MNVRGDVILTAVRGGVVTAEVRGKNLFLNEGADILARVISGDVDYVPNYVYFEFQNGGVPPVVEPAVDEGRDYYAGLETTGPAVDRDYLRVPLLGRPNRTASAAAYDGNVVNFLCISSGAEGVSGLSFSSAAGTQVYGVALVSAPRPADRSHDRVFARWYPESAAELPPGGQLVVQWPYRFTA